MATDSEKKQIKIARDVRFASKTKHEASDRYVRKWTNLSDEGEEDEPQKARPHRIEETDSEEDDIIRDAEDIVEDEAQQSADEESGVRVRRKSERERRQPDRDYVMLTYKEAFTTTNKSGKTLSRKRRGL